MIYQGWEDTPWYLRLAGYKRRRRLAIDPNAHCLSNRQYWVYGD